MRWRSCLLLTVTGLASSCGGNIDTSPTEGASSAIEMPAPTNLFHAAQLGDLTAVQQYISQGISVTNRHPENGQTALHYAAWSGHTGTVAWLISQEADLNAVDNEGKAPLDFAWMPRGKAASNLLRSAGAKQGNKPHTPETTNSNINPTKDSPAKL